MGNQEALQIGFTVGSLTVMSRAGSDRHGNAMWRCKCICGQDSRIVTQSLKSGHTTSCGCAKRRRGINAGSKNGAWKGGKCKQNGYTMIRLPEHHRAHSNGYVMEHIVLMEELLGRPLLPGENVHHKNGVRDDNHPENLELWVTTQPSGQRPEDLVRWAREILARYDKN